MELSSNPFSRAHLDDPDRKRQKVVLELPTGELSASRLTLDNCYITEVLAFPRSLAVLQSEVLHWNATCWLHRFPIPRLTMRKIADHCNNPMLHEGQIFEFKGSQRSNETFLEVPEICLLVVFPHVEKSFDSKEVQRIWTDDIVLPSIYRHVGSGTQQQLPTSYRLLRLNTKVNKVNKVELGLKIGDTPLCVSFRSDSLEGVWADIVRKTKENGVEEFSDTFLVALGQWHPNATINESLEGRGRRSLLRGGVWRLT